MTDWVTVGVSFEVLSFTLACKSVSNLKHSSKYSLLKCIKNKARNASKVNYDNSTLFSKLIKELIIISTINAIYFSLLCSLSISEDSYEGQR